jgi:peptidoglycan/LPS O-acetylase OafA/YrhL
MTAVDAAPLPVTGARRAGFRPDVEGLRALAIALVVCYHYRFGRVHGGNTGVDVFFVISGFVITSMLLRERAASERTSLADFYARRVRRILPAATVTLLATLVVSWLLLPADAIRSIAGDARSAALFYSNVRLRHSAGALHQATGLYTPVGQFWSLSIEEQFYFVWPTVLLVICGLVKVARQRVALGLALAAVVAGSLTLSHSWTTVDRNAAYFSSFTRAGELALGALVAVCLPLLRRVPASLGAALSWVGLAGIVTGGFVITDQHVYPGLLYVLPIGCTALAIAGGTTAGRFGAGAILGTRAMVALGAISYSLYLWHFPIITFAQDRLGHVPSLSARLALLALAICVSIASYLWLENPIRKSRFLAQNRAVTFVFGACLVAATVGTSLVVGASVT